MDLLDMLHVFLRRPITPPCHFLSTVNLHMVQASLSYEELKKTSVKLLYFSCIFLFDLTPIWTSNFLLHYPDSNHVDLFPETTFSFPNSGARTCRGPNVGDRTSGDRTSGTERQFALIISISCLFKYKLPT